ncbi:hypothetical protein OG455_36960 [Kitasatospora sp. NBC_01287]|uniref:hypothetical protein n=1 Tax=Kitasatospora sp. NBC_01287 TaxID=2903573 RepID=UPI002251A927|nr:hypothetical protein [Kitasatospora sp. NBC_01287]MCX4751033.1 hypothetical protein [Kitasatospora sp. NBC_01287]
MKPTRGVTVLAAAALATTLGLAGASPAAAATTGRSVACHTGTITCGSGTFTLSGNRKLTDGALSVLRWCTTGPGGSRIALEVFEADHRAVWGSWHSNNLGCGRYQRVPASGDTLTFTAGSDICAWRVVTSDTPSHAQTVDGTFQWNPSHPKGC